MIRRWQSRRFWRRLQAGKTARVPKHLDPTHRQFEEGANPFVTMTLTEGLSIADFEAYWRKRGK